MRSGKSKLFAQNCCVTSNCPFKALVVRHEQQASSVSWEARLILQIAIGVAERDASALHQVRALLGRRVARVDLANVTVNRTFQTLRIAAVVEVVRSRVGIDRSIAEDQRRAVFEAAYDHCTGALIVWIDKSEGVRKGILAHFEALHVLLELPVDKETSVAVGCDAVRVVDQGCLARSKARIPFVDTAVLRHLAAVGMLMCAARSYTRYSARVGRL